MKVTVYSTPNMIKEKRLGIKYNDPTGRIMDSGLLNFGKNWHDIMYKTIPELRNEGPIEWTYDVYSDSMEPNEALDRRHGVEKSLKLREALKEAVESGNYNPLFSPLDKENPAAFLPIIDRNEKGEPIVDKNGKKTITKFIPQFAHLNQDMYNFGSDYWKLDPEEFKQAFMGYLAGEGNAPLHGADTERDKMQAAASAAGSSSRSGAASDYISKIFGEGTLTREQREAIAESMPADFKNLFQSLISKHQWRKDDEGNTVVDLNTGYGSASQKGQHRSMKLKAETLKKWREQRRQGDINEINRQNADVERSMQNVEFSDEEKRKQAIANSQLASRSSGDRAEEAQAKASEHHNIGELYRGYIRGAAKQLGASKDAIKDVLPRGQFEKMLDWDDTSGKHTFDAEKLNQFVSEHLPSDTQKNIVNALVGD